MEPLYRPEGVEERWQQAWEGEGLYRAGAGSRRDDTFVTVRSVDTLIRRLRGRIEPDPKRPRFLLTVWGVGYKFSDA